MNRVFLAAVLAAALTSAAVAQSGKPRMDSATFRQAAMSSEAFEIAASRLALQRTTTPRVQQFAERMIQDHSMITASLTGNPGPLGTAAAAPRAAPATNGTVGSAGSAPASAALEPRHAAMLSQLAAAQGRAFDRLYKRMQIQVHREAVALYSGYAKGGDDPALASLARRTLPHLRTHLEDAEEM